MFGCRYKTCYIYLLVNEHNRYCLAHLRRLWPSYKRNILIWICRWYLWNLANSLRVDVLFELKRYVSVVDKSVNMTAFPIHWCRYFISCKYAIYCILNMLNSFWKIYIYIHILHMYNISTMKVSNISRTLVGEEIVDHSDVVGASPVGAAPTTSSFST